MAHEQHDDHSHRHGPGCGHESVRHGDHSDYVHDGHRHAEHAGHWDEHDSGARATEGWSGAGADALGVSRTDSGSAASTWASGPEDRPEGSGDVGGS